MSAAPVRLLRDRVLTQCEHPTVRQLLIRIEATNWEEDETLQSDASMFVTLRDRCCNMPQIRQPLLIQPFWSIRMNRLHLAVNRNDDHTEYCSLDKYLQQYTAFDCQSSYQHDRGVQLLSSQNRHNEAVFIAPLQFCPVSAESGSPHRFSVHVRNAPGIPGDTLVLVSRASSGTMSFITRKKNRQCGTEIFERQSGMVPVRFRMPKQPELLIVVQIPLIVAPNGQKPLLHRDLFHRMHATLQIVYPEDHWTLDNCFFRNIDSLFTNLQCRQHRYFPHTIDFPSSLAMHI